MSDDKILSDAEITALLAGLNPDVSSGDDQTEREINEDEHDFDALKKAAEEGDAGAQLRLGVCYSQGENVKQDSEQAVYWYEKAALQGDAGAQCLLAMRYDGGDGVERDALKAFYWYEKSALQGDDTAQGILGVYYERGEDVLQDYQKAAYWYEKAAAQENPRSQLNLGVLYEQGNGVNQDYSKAAVWYEKAALQDESIAQLYLGLLYENGNGVAKDHEQAGYWFKKASEDHLALESLDQLYAEGKLKNFKYKTAMEWYQAYASSGSAALNYASIIREKDEEDVDLYILSVRWQEQAARKGNINSFYQLAMNFNFNRENIDSILEVFGEREIVPSASCVAELVNKFYPIPDSDKKTELSDDELAALKTRIASLVEITRMGSVFALDNKIENETNSVLRTGLKMIYDGLDLSIINVVMENLLSGANGEVKKIIQDGIIKIQRGGRL